METLALDWYIVVGIALGLACLKELITWLLERKATKKREMDEWLKGGRKYKKDTALYNNKV